jgi:outer membrane protein
MRYVLYIFCFSTIGANLCEAQEKITLFESIDLFLSKSNVSRVLSLSRDINLISDELRQISLLPLINLSSAIPNFSRSISPVVLPDGSESFRERNTANSSLSLALSQKIAFTGGSINLSTGLSRLDQFGTNRSTSYSNNIFNISYLQPLINTKEYKWEKLLRPVQLAQRSIQDHVQLEGLAIEIVQKYFSLLILSKKMESFLEVKAKTDSIYYSIKEQEKLGRSEKLKEMQIRSNLLDIHSSISELNYNLTKAKREFNDLLKIESATNYHLLEPEVIDVSLLDVKDVITLALENNFEVEKSISEINTERALLSAKMNRSGVKANLSLSYGSNNSFIFFEDFYTDVRVRQSLSLSLNLPILDWGRGDKSYEIAKIRSEIDRINLSIKEIEFYNQIEDLVYIFNFQINKIGVKKDRILINIENIKILKYLFDKGEVSYADYSDGLNGKIQAESDYLNQLQEFWLTYYKLRQLTGYDFINNRQLMDFHY